MYEYYLLCLLSIYACLYSPLQSYGHQNAFLFDLRIRIRLDDIQLMADSSIFWPRGCSWLEIEIGNNLSGRQAYSS
jgi:hypothetical protein